jgi:hypothetical protein
MMKRDTAQIYRYLEPVAMILDVLPSEKEHYMGMCTVSMILYLTSCF